MKKTLMLLLGVSLIASLSMFAANQDDPTLLKPVDSDEPPHERIYHEYSKEAHDKTDTLKGEADEKVQHAAAHADEYHVQVDSVEKDPVAHADEIADSSVKPCKKVVPSVKGIGSCQTQAEVEAVPQHDLDKNVQ